MHQTVRCKKQIIKSNKISEVNSYASGLQKYRSIPKNQIKFQHFTIIPTKENYVFFTEDFSVKLTQIFPSYLIQSESFASPRVLANIGTQCNALYAVD